MNAVSAFLYNFLNFSQFVLYELAVSHFPNHSLYNKTRDNNLFTKATKMLVNHLIKINFIWKHIFFQPEETNPQTDVLWVVFFPNEVYERTKRKKKEGNEFWHPNTS